MEVKRGGCEEDWRGRGLEVKMRGREGIDERKEGGGWRTE